MAGEHNRELIELLKSNILEEKERNDRHTTLLNEFIAHLKNEIERKNKDIDYKNEILKNYLNHCFTKEKNRGRKGHNRNQV